LDRLIAKSQALLKLNDANDVALLGPYLGRSILELGMTALVSRFDPMRVLAIRKIQISPDYNLKVRNFLAFDWADDVQGQGQSKRWNERPKIVDLQRSLLGGHYHDLFWEEAVQHLFDATADGRGAQWMASLRRTAPEDFTTRTRTEASMLYSQMSKGVHQELVIPAIAQFDIATVTDLITRAYELLGALGLTASASPSIRAISSESPLDAYERCQQELVP
jgi:hypothetical protein